MLLRQCLLLAHLHIYQAQLAAPFGLAAQVQALRQVAAAVDNSKGEAGEGAVDLAVRCSCVRRPTWALVPPTLQPALVPPNLFSRIGLRLDASIPSRSTAWCTGVCGSAACALLGSGAPPRGSRTASRAGGHAYALESGRLLHLAGRTDVYGGAGCAAAIAGCHACLPRFIRPCDKNVMRNDGSGASVGQKRHHSHAWRRQFRVRQGSMGASISRLVHLLSTHSADLWLLI